MPEVFIQGGEGKLQAKYSPSEQEKPNIAIILHPNPKHGGTMDTKVNYAAFKVKFSNLDIIKGADVIIWTTTPWTIPANKALAYNASLKYVLLEINDNKNFVNRKIVIAKDLLEPFKKDTSIENIKVLKEFSGKDLGGTICSHPFSKMGYDYDIPMLEANFVTTEQGTGIVHCAPSHGPDDFNLCLNNNIKAIETVDGDGKYTNEIKHFEGLHIFKANNLIIEKLNEQKNLVTTENLLTLIPILGDQKLH